MHWQEEKKRISRFYTKNDTEDISEAWPPFACLLDGEENNWSAISTIPSYFLLPPFRIS